MGYSSSAVRRFLNYVLSVRGVSASALARESGINHVTLTRFLNNPGNNSTLSPTTIRKIEARVGIKLVTLAGEDAKRGEIAKHSDGTLLFLKADGSVEPFKGYLAFDVDDPSEPTQESHHRALIRSIAPIEGTIGARGTVHLKLLPKDFHWQMVQFPFDAHEAPRAWFVDTETLLPRYAYGDVLLCWGEARSLGLYETGEAIVWTEDGVGQLGNVSIQAGAYAISVLGEKTDMRVVGKEVDFIRAVVRDGNYLGVNRPSA